MGQKEVENENYCGVFEMRDLARFFSEVLNFPFTISPFGVGVGGGKKGNGDW